MDDFSEIKVEAQRNALFETPIVLAKFKNADRLVEALTTSILDKQRTSDGLQRSNVGGWHSDTDMMRWGGAAAALLADKTVAVAKRLSFFADRSHDDFDWRCQMWANVSVKGAWNHTHVHPGNLWSAVFYIDMGGENCGGAFYFEDPRFPISAMHNTRFRFAGADGQPQAWQPELNVSRGDLLMFPSWLRHGVRPYEGDGHRISIAINVDAIPKR